MGCVWENRVVQGHYNDYNPCLAADNHHMFLTLHTSESLIDLESLGPNSDPRGSRYFYKLLLLCVKLLVFPHLHISLNKSVCY